MRKFWLKAKEEKRERSLPLRHQGKKGLLKRKRNQDNHENLRSIKIASIKVAKTTNDEGCDATEAKSGNRSSPNKKIKLSPVLLLLIL